MKPQQFLTFVAIAVASYTQLDAQQVPTEVISLEWATTRDSRRAQATEWLAEISALANQIPTLSPAETAWLQVEYDDQLTSNAGTFTPRALRARLSKEGSARFAKPVADEIVGLLGQLASASPLPRQREVALWSGLAYLTLGSTFWQDVSRLGELGVIARDSESKWIFPGFDAHGLGLQSLWAARSQYILGHYCPVKSRIESIG